MSTGHANDWWRPASVCNLTRMLAVDKLVYMDATPEEWPRRIALNASSKCNLRHNYVISHRALKTALERRADQRHERVQQRWRERPRFLGLPDDPSCSYSPLYHPTRAEVLPPGARILVLGNSHTNQLLQSLLCRFHAEIMHATLRNPECDGCPLRLKEPAFDAGSCAVNVSTSDPLFNAPMSEQLRRIQFRNGAQLTLIYNSPLLYYDNADLPASIRRLLGVPTLDDFDAIVYHHLNYLNNYTLAPFTAQCGEEIAAHEKLGAFPSALTFASQLSVSGYPGALLVDSVDERNIFYNRGADTLCAASAALTRTGRVATYCWNYLRRYTRDFRSEWECALDMFYHQCVPGPLDASADIWIATLWRLSTEHRRPRAW